MKIWHIPLIHKHGVKNKYLYISLAGHICPWDNWTLFYVSYKIKHMNYAVIYPELPCTHNEHGVYRPADVSPLKYSLRLRLRCRKQKQLSFNSISVSVSEDLRQIENNKITSILFCWWLLKSSHETRYFHHMRRRGVENTENNSQSEMINKTINHLNYENTRQNKTNTWLQKRIYTRISIIPYMLLNHQLWQTHAKLHRQIFVF